MEEYTVPGFKTWLVSRGRDPDTATGYGSDVLLCLVHPRGLLGRLRERNLAPKTLRRTLASLRAWAKYSNDAALSKQLGDIKLPPPNRKVVKIPLTKDQWQNLILEIDRADYLSPAERAAIGIMACGGLRIGDVLRMTKSEVLNGIASGVLIYEAKGRKRLEVGTKSIKIYLDILAKYENWEKVHDLVTTRAKRLQSSGTQQLSRCLKEVGEKIGIPSNEMYPHRLRRTYATYFLEAVGGNLEKLRAKMSWSSLATAASYADHHAREELDSIADGMFDTKNKGD